MNKVDKEYCTLLKEILDYGRYKDSRAGETISLFGKSMRFNLQDGLPLLTTKKVFYKGIIHELLWFLNRPFNVHRSMNIKYLIDNNVHIWTDDAYRWFKEVVEKEIVQKKREFYFLVPTVDDELAMQTNETVSFHFWERNDDFKNNVEWLKQLDKEAFIDLVQRQVEIRMIVEKQEDGSFKTKPYRFGDLGPVYGKQWRAYGISEFDQIQNIVKTLKTNPNDRRMLCIAFNPDVLGDVALPPCHMMFQFYTYELQPIERLAWLCEHSNGEYDEWKTTTHEKMDELNVPRYSLSCSFTMRSNDFCCGNPYNIAQYAMLTYMLCEVCNMVPGELVYNGGDVHVYTNHIEGAKEQLSRNGSEIIPKLKFNRKVTDINDFKYEDFIIEDYYPDAPIKYALNVGL